MCRCSVLWTLLEKPSTAAHCLPPIKRMKTEVTARAVEFSSANPKLDNGVFYRDPKIAIRLQISENVPAKQGRGSLFEHLMRQQPGTAVTLSMTSAFGQQDMPCVAGSGRPRRRGACAGLPSITGTVNQ